MLHMLVFYQKIYLIMNSVDDSLIMLDVGLKPTSKHKNTKSVEKNCSSIKHHFLSNFKPNKY